MVRFLYSPAVFRRQRVNASVDEVVSTTAATYPHRRHTAEIVGQHLRMHILCDSACCFSRGCDACTAARLVRTGALLCRFDFCHVALQPPLRQQHGQFEIRGGAEPTGAMRQHWTLELYTASTRWSLFHPHLKQLSCESALPAASRRADPFIGACSTPRSMPPCCNIRGTFQECTNYGNHNCLDRHSMR